MYLPSSSFFSGPPIIYISCKIHVISKGERWAKNLPCQCAFPKALLQHCGHCFQPSTFLYAHPEFEHIYTYLPYICPKTVLSLSLVTFLFKFLYKFKCHLLAIAEDTDGINCWFVNLIHTYTNKGSYAFKKCMFRPLFWNLLEKKDIENLTKTANTLSKG